jgi:hypothetical protein
VPKGVIKEAKMVAIIKDMQMMEALHKDIGLYGIKKRELSDTSFTIIFNEYSISASDFDSSLHFYTQHPKMMERIMTTVSRELEREYE